MHHLSFFRAVLSLSVACLAFAPRVRAASATITVGQSVTLSVASDGTAPFTYQWYKNGLALAGATSASLVITGAQLTSTGIYYATVANAAGQVTSDTASLTVNPLAVAPVITVHPLGQTVTTGSTVTFSAAATGLPAPTLQWRRNGVNIAGATAMSHTISAVSLAVAGSYSLVATNTAGSATSQAAVLTVTGLSAPLAVGADFNGDGWSDLLWQNTTTGECSAWLMNGLTKTGSVVLGTAGVGWQIVGTGDFNGDEKSDILWRNQSTGANRVWLMSGTTVASTLNLTALAGPWVIGGTGDFNNDGRQDLVWRNPTTRESRIWLMNGGTFAQNVSLGIAGANWQVQAAGDFNGDEQSDLVWMNTSNRQVQIQLMTGVQLGTTIKLDTITSGWTVAGTCDLNDDGRSDILWQGPTGQCIAWLINGASISARPNLPAVPAGLRLRN